MSISSEPLDKAAAVTLSDSAIQLVGNVPPRAFLVTTAGDLKITTTGDSIVTVPVDANVIYPISVKRFWSTGSTAADVLMFA